MKKTIAILLAMILCCLALVACGAGAKMPADPAKAIVGTWDSKDFPDMGFTYIFEEDGTGSYVGEKISYTIDGNKISIAFEDTESFDTEFEIKGDELNIKDSLGMDTIYVRK